MSRVVLEAKGLSRSYSHRRAQTTFGVLDDASLTLHAGEMVALVAPSGTGKSTLLHCLGLLERPQSGLIHIAGKETGQLSDQDRTHLRRHHIGFVFQHHGLLSEFSAQENVAMPLRLTGASIQEATQTARAFLANMGLEDRFHHRPAELSGGEQQRVAIARALAKSPAVLLADEPTGNLDPETGGAIFSLLLEQCRQHDCAVLAATHNIAMAQRMDRCVTLQNRQIINLSLQTK